MNKIMKISPLKRKSSGKPGSIRESLTQGGYERVPGAMVPLSPFKERDGSFRTGMDENALYINSLPVENQEAEREYVRQLAEMAKKFYGTVGLGSRDAFYTDMYKRYGDNTVCKPYFLKEGDNTFDLGEPDQLITFAWMRVYPWVAPSSAALKTAKYSHCRYYVNDSNEEAKNEFKTKDRIVKALVAARDLTPTQLRQVARLCGLPVSEVDPEESVSVKLYDYINEAALSGKTINLNTFEHIINMPAEETEIRDAIKLAFEYGVLTNRKNAIYLGNERYAANENEVFEKVFGPKNHDAFEVIKHQLQVRKSQIHA